METLNIFVRFQFVDDNKYGTPIKRTELGTTYTIHVPTMYYHLWAIIYKHGDIRKSDVYRIYV
jgi:hypothetical protein